jgi:hypothetical protein
VPTVLLLLGSLPTLRSQQPPGPDRVGKIIIEGNTDAPDAVILRQLDLAGAATPPTPGGVVRYPKLEEARVRLKRLGFDPDDEPTVEVVPSKVNNGIGFVDIRIRVRARDWDWLAFSHDALAGITTLDVDRIWVTTYRLRLKLVGNSPAGPRA